LFSAYHFHVDHVIARKHRGKTELDNLAWACTKCNGSKGSDIASLDPLTDDLTPLYNPRKHVWEEHFEFDGPKIVGATPIGRTSEFILRLNHPKQVEIRAILLEADLWDDPPQL
jgi:hypothetical protein